MYVLHFEMPEEWLKCRSAGWRGLPRLGKVYGPQLGSHMEPEDKMTVREDHEKLQKPQDHQYALLYKCLID